MYNNVKHASRINGSILSNQGHNYSVSPKRTWVRKMPYKKTYFQNYQQVKATRTLSHDTRFFQIHIPHTYSQILTSQIHIPFCIPSLYPHCSKYNKYHQRNFDKTRVSTHTKYYRQGINFLYFQLISELAAVLGIALKHATTKHAQTMGVLQRTHTMIKTSLKMASGENGKPWHKYLSVAILN